MLLLPLLMLLLPTLLRLMLPLPLLMLLLPTLLLFDHSFVVIHIHGLTVLFIGDDA
jgi:hypothetical protein